MERASGQEDESLDKEIERFSEAHVHAEVLFLCVFKMMSASSAVHCG